jgi:drug/metabolite transporter (DMT)-like permease
MFALIGTVCCSSVLFLIFRLFPKYGIHTGQAIVFNYFTAFITGSIVSQRIPDMVQLQKSGLIPWLILCGFLFISLFISMGVSSQKNGMGTTSVAVKMSLALSSIALMIIHQEIVQFAHIIGLVLAIGAILLITYSPKTENKTRINYSLIGYLFVGSAALDILLNAIKNTFAKGYPDELFTAFGFLFAGGLGLLWILVEIARKRQTLSGKNILGGILLGIPNFFSIYFLVKSYESKHWNDATVLALMNISIVSLAALLGIIIFKESATKIKMLGLALAVAAIVTMTL